MMRALSEPTMPGTKAGLGRFPDPRSSLVTTAGGLACGQRLGTGPLPPSCPGNGVQA